MRLTTQAGVLNEGSVDESAASFTLGAYRGVTDHGHQASGSLDSDASHPQTDTAVPHAADSAGSAVPSEPAVATAVDLADSDCSTEAALDQTSAHSCGSPGAAGMVSPQPLFSDSGNPTTVTSSSGSQLFRRHVSTAEVGSAIQPTSDDSSAGASSGADKLAARGVVSSGHEGSQPVVSSFPQGGEGVTPAESPGSSRLDMFSGREASFKLTPTSLPGGGQAPPPAVDSSATVRAEQVSAFAWQAAQLQSVTHATNADEAAPVSGTAGEDTMQRSGSTEEDVQSVVSFQQQASCSEQQQQDLSSVTQERGLESVANAQQSVAQQDTSSSAVFEEEAQRATAAAAPVQPHQSLQQSAAEEEQQQHLPGRSAGHDAHDYASADVEDCKVPANPGRQEEERIALLTQAKEEEQPVSSPDPVREEEEQGPSQLANEEEEQGLRQSAAQADKQQTPPSSPLREDEEQAFSQSVSEAAEEEQRPTDPSHDAEQSADTSVPLLLSLSSPVSEEEAAHQLHTSNADGARLPASDTSFRADSSSQRKAKPGFLAKALFCSVAWPVLVPIVAFSSCIQLYDACSMTEVLRYTV